MKMDKRLSIARLVYWAIVFSYFVYMIGSDRSAGRNQTWIVLYIMISMWLCRAVRFTRSEKTMWRVGALIFVFVIHALYCGWITFTVFRGNLLMSVFSGLIQFGIDMVFLLGVIRIMESSKV